MLIQVPELYREKIRALALVNRNAIHWYPDKCLLAAYDRKRRNLLFVYQEEDSIFYDMLEGFDCFRYYVKDVALESVERNTREHAALINKYNATGKKPLEVIDIGHGDRRSMAKAIRYMTDAEISCRSMRPMLRLPFSKLALYADHAELYGNGCLLSAGFRHPKKTGKRQTGKAECLSFFPQFGDQSKHD